jgi:hypothetical protein
VAVAIFAPRNKPRALAEATRRELRLQGFKVDVAEFDLAVPATSRPRLETLALAGKQFRPLLPNRDYGLMRPVTETSASVLWKERAVAGETSEDFWPALESDMELQGPALDTASLELQSGIIRFEPAIAPSGDLALPYMVQIRSLASALATRMVLDLRNSNRPRAWTNLLALTRLVTAWQTEPFEVAWMVRFRCVGTAQRALWQALQADGWTDSQLLLLQQEWSRPDFFSGLPETAALARADLLALCRRQRLLPPAPGPSLRQIGSELLTSPDRAWLDATAGMRLSHYRNYGSYEDETSIMLCFRERELDLRHAITAKTWSEMRARPGATNAAPFNGSPQSPIFPAVNNRPTNFGYQRPGPSLLTRAAEAETRRRLSVTALALKRCRLARGAYPGSLVDLVPDFLDQTPLDFMDGQPLRYRLLDEANFMLYSVGLDCHDDNGRMIAASNLPFQGVLGPIEELDITWPRPASPAEVESTPAPWPRFGMSPRGADVSSPSRARYGLPNPAATNSSSAGIRPPQ